jgi:cellulose synthase/poly-beta-1,6-N-acetylglucosamine synthase-like glycosyltransferase
MLAKIRLTLLSVWLGAMAYFSFIVAPAAFAVLPTRQLAGNLVNRALGITELIGIVLGATLLVLLFAARAARRKAFWFELVLLSSMTIAMLVSRFVVSQRLHGLRAQLGDVSALAATDPNRLAFDQLHQYSVWLMSFALMAALVLIVLLIRQPAVKPAAQFHA